MIMSQPIQKGKTSIKGGYNNGSIKGISEIKS